MIEREISAKALSLAGQFPVVSITGPRQSGKSTLVKALFPSYSYVSLEDEDWRAFATDDPRGFLARFGRRTVIDEAQRVPSLFSYLQGRVDQTGDPGQYVSMREDIPASTTGALTPPTTTPTTCRPTWRGTCARQRP